MNDEIKEILIFIENKIYPKDSLLFEKWTSLKDYITNLQQENESLRIRIKTIKRLRKKQTQKKNKYKSIIFDEEQKLKDYKSRCKKAIEILKRYGNGTFDEELLNILQNGSDDNG